MKQQLVEEESAQGKEEQMEEEAEKESDNVVQDLNHLDEELETTAKRSKKKTRSWGLGCSNKRDVAKDKPKKVTVSEHS